MLGLEVKFLNFRFIYFFIIQCYFFILQELFRFIFNLKGKEKDKYLRNGFNIERRKNKSKNQCGLLYNEVVFGFLICKLFNVQD